jgi:AcrR family transcriptional regulator
MNDGDRRLTSQGLERKQQLLDAAARLFAERGYAETRIVDICREAGVAKGLFYWYFDTKEAVFRDLAGDLRQRLRREQARAMAGHDDPLQQIRQGSEASVRFMAAHARSFSLIAVENVDRQFVDDIRSGTELHADDSARLIASGIEAGLIRDEDPRLLAYSVLTTVGWFAHLLHTGRLGMSIDELTAFVGRHVVCSLAASEQVVRTTLAVPAQSLGGSDISPSTMASSTT